LANLPLVFKVKASESGKIFGSVTSQMVADALAAKGVEVDKKLITVESFKVLGSYTAEVRLHKHVKGTINFTVEPEGALVKEEKDEVAPKKAAKAPVAEAVEAAEVAPEAVPAAPAAPEVAPEAPAAPELPAEE
jgi:large subunit ribosomal protein L9